MEYIFIWLIFALLGAVIGKQKDLAAAGFFLGLILGPLGLIIIALMQGNRANCPHCDSLISAHASVCPKCTKQISGEKVQDQSHKSRQNFEQWKREFIKQDPANKYLSKDDLTKCFDEFRSRQRSSVEESNAIQTLKSASTTLPEARLNKIKDLYEKGLIDLEDYKAQKERILSEI